MSRTASVAVQWRPTNARHGAWGRDIKRTKAIYERGEVKRAGAENLCAGSSRTSPSPSASVDLAHLRPRPRSRFVHSRHTSPEPEAEGEAPSASSIHSRADADVIVTLNHLCGIVRSTGRRQESGIQGTPPFNGPKVGDGAAVGVRYGVVHWSSRPPGHRLSPLDSRSGPVRSPSPHRDRRFVTPAGPPTARLRLADLQEVVVRAVAEHRVHHAPAADAPPPRSPSCPRPLLDAFDRSAATPRSGGPPARPPPPAPTATAANPPW